MKRSTTFTLAPAAPIIGLMLCPVGQSARAACSTPSFNPQVPYPTGAMPLSVAIADVNKDGKPDIIVDDQLSNGTVSVLLGNGDGTFQPKLDYSVGKFPFAVAVGDLNNDGAPDIVTCNQNSNNPSNVSILVGDGTGYFYNDGLYPVDAAPHAIVIADLNGDLIPDILTANYGSHGGSLSALLGIGYALFNPHIDSVVATGIYPTALALADFNGDKKPDAVVTSSTSDPSDAFVALGNGDGTFKAGVGYDVTGIPTSVAAGDVDGDGKQDIVVANVGSTESDASVLLGNGDGTFKPKKDYKVGSIPYATTLADVNGDGKLDIVTANYGDSTISVLLGRGDGTFDAKVDYPTPGNPYSVAVADLDVNGSPDIVTANYNDPTVSVFLNACPDFVPPTTTADVANVLKEAAGLLTASTADVTKYDFNGDHILTLADAVRLARKVAGL